METVAIARKFSGVVRFLRGIRPGLAYLTHGLEARWVCPAYSGGLLLALAVFFFAAATNTLAGWLYVISGLILGLLAIAANLTRRHLQGLVVERRTIQPTMAGETLVMEIRLHNPQPSMKGPWQLIDPVPAGLGSMTPVAIEALAPGQTRLQSYRLTTRQRGLYSWPYLTLRTAAPLGLFWSQGEWAVAARVLVYPQILALRQCPWLEALGQGWGATPTDHRSWDRPQEGTTRSLRPYRWGDPTRLIHWRSSARYGSFRLREIEPPSQPTSPILALNTTAPWSASDFEQAVIATASLYSYLQRQGWQARLWLPSGPGSAQGLRDRPAVLTALATVLPTPGPTLASLPRSPLVWITTSGQPTPTQPPGSGQIRWGKPQLSPSGSQAQNCRWINSQRPLIDQLEADGTPPQSALLSGATVEKELPQPQV